MQSTYTELENARTAAMQGADALATMTAAVRLAARDAASGDQWAGAARAASAEKVQTHNKRLTHLREVASQILKISGIACDVECRRVKGATDGPFSLACDKLREAAAKPTAKDLAIMVFGTGSNGKSTLLNAIFGQNLLPTSSIDCTSNITNISGTHGREKMMIHRAGDPPQLWEEHELATPDSGPRMPEHLVKDKQIDEIKVEIQHPLLQGNVRVMDVPGLNQTTENNVKIKTAFGKCHTLLVVCSAVSSTGAGFTHDERQRLQFWKNEMHGMSSIFVVCNKMDAIAKPTALV
eukprot:COSAG01_NODE_15591_length_1321_cov_0.988543_1_plen_293_part_10